ncbi:MAG: heavy-metal-associated domain-containing protein [Clostridia bacterium]|nr:heavy-metal-associated domain-containing protein [Clostridia bacterium]
MERKIYVPDMHCENCVRRIDNALKEIKITATVNLETKTVTVSGCEHCYKKAFDEIYDLGFTPENA